MKTQEKELALKTKPYNTKQQKLPPKPEEKSFRAKLITFFKAKILGLSFEIP